MSYEIEIQRIQQMLDECEIVSVAEDGSEGE
jgi:hypothetical protein